MRRVCVQVNSAVHHDRDWSGWHVCASGVAGTNEPGTGVPASAPLHAWVPCLLHQGGWMTSGMLERWRCWGCWGRASNGSSSQLRRPPRGWLQVGSGCTVTAGFLPVWSCMECVDSVGTWVRTCGIPYYLDHDRRESHTPSGVVCVHGRGAKQHGVATAARVLGLASLPFSAWAKNGTGTCRAWKTEWATPCATPARALPSPLSPTLGCVDGLPPLPRAMRRAIMRTTAVVAYACAPRVGAVTAIRSGRNTH